MKMIILILALIGIGAGAVAFWPEKKLGAVNIPDSCFTVNGVTSCESSQALSFASSTACALASPAATSTLMLGSVQLNTATSVDTFWELARSVRQFSTTTLLSNTFAWAAGGKDDVGGTIVASTAPTGISMIFPPRSWLVVRGVAKNNDPDDGQSSSTPGVAGTCKAVWLIN